ncbi:hypothetical protein FRB90_007068 [Tulasnella sp. 427]|nr:hypothetical protein FRB90_007068 [Tulasnella sp. 427]
MERSEVLQKYIIVTPSFSEIPFDQNHLGPFVEELTQWALIFDHQDGIKTAPNPKYIRNTLFMKPTWTCHVLEHASHTFSVVIFSAEGHVEKALRNKHFFADKYVVRNLRTEDNATTTPTPVQPDPNVTSKHNISEEAEIQWYLKAYFLELAEEKDQKLIEHLNSADLSEPVPDSLLSHLGPIPGEKKKARKRGGKGKARADGERMTSASTTTYAPDTNPEVPSSSATLPSPPPPTSNAIAGLTSSKRLRSPSPDQTETASVLNTEDEKHSALMAVLNDALGDVLQVALACKPLLQEIAQADNAVHQEAQEQGYSLLPELQLPGVDKSIITQLKDIHRLRCAVPVPLDSRVVSHDLKMRASVYKALTRILELE